jgi:hypothetical protein
MVFLGCSLSLQFGLKLDLPAAVKERPERMLKTYLQAGQAGGFKERKRTAYIVGNTGICMKG